MAQRRLRAKGWEVRWEAVEARRAEQTRAGGGVAPPPPVAVRGGRAVEGRDRYAFQFAKWGSQFADRCGSQTVCPACIAVCKLRHSVCKLVQFANTVR